MARVTPTQSGAVAYADVTSGNSITFNKSDLPTLADGDLLVAVIRGSTSATTSAVTCTGFTQQAPEAYTVSSNGRLIALLTKPIPTGAASEPSTYVFAYTGTAGRMSGALFVVKNVDLSAPVSGHGAPGNSPNYYSSTTFAVNIGDLVLACAGNETVTPNPSDPTVDPDYTQVASHPSTTGTAATRACVWVGKRVADTTTAPSPASTVWASTSGLAYWAVSLQGTVSNTGVLVKKGNGDSARLWTLVGGVRANPVSAKMFLPGYHTVSAAIARSGVTMGHRGASLTPGMPEMSERSYDYSVMRGLGILEFSANRTSDGVWVGCHDPTLNRTSETTGLPNISSQTWATVQTFQNTLNDGGVPRPYYLLTTFLDKYAPHHVCWVDPKSSVGQVTEFLDLCDAHGGPTRIVVKYTGNSSGGAALSDAAILRGYQTWGYFYETDGQTAVDLYKGRYTILGMNWDASATAWGWVTGLGKKVVAHVCASQAAYNTGIAMGASIVQCSRPDLITPVSVWN